MTAIMKIAIATTIILSVAGCSRNATVNRGHSFYPPISTNQMERILDHPSHPGVILNGESHTAIRHYR